LTQTPQLSVIVPCYNERGTVLELLRRVVEVPISKEVIVVDDCSTDGSFDLVANFAKEHPSIRHLRQDRNRGKGAALRRGIEEAAGDIVLIQDADLEYDPSDYPKLVEPIAKGDADVVFGSRFAGHPRRVMLYWHTLGNQFLTWLSNITTNLNLTDMETCYKVFRRDVIQSIKLNSDRFGFEPEVTAKLASRGYRIYEVPISYHGREYWEGKKINWKDGVNAVWTILKYGLLKSGDSEPGGFVTLDRMGSLKHYNRWIFDAIEPYVGKRVLEVGAGTGNMTRLLYGRELIVSTDVEKPYIDRLRNRFRRTPTIIVDKFDLSSQADLDRVKKHNVDTVVAFNVLEHIEDDVAALQHMAEVLPAGGRVLLFVPADQKLFGTMDTQVGHYRRYSRESLEKTIETAGLKPEKIHYQNEAGRFGWWFNGRILKRTHIPAAQSKIFDIMVPFFRAMEPKEPKKGLSLVAVARVDS